MKLGDVGLCLLGGSVLYVSMAACSAKSPGSTTSRAGGGGAILHEGVGGAGGLGQLADSGLDALGDPVPSASADPTAGARLRPKYRSSEDGAKEFIAGAWWDSMRGEDCTFKLAADGKMRCLPDGVEFRYYSDAQCNTAMALMQGACSAPQYATSGTQGACGLDPAATHVYALGGVTQPSQIYAKAGGSCYAVGQAAPDWQYFTVGAEIPATSFVSADIKHD